jgi:hypothetical protein
MPTWNGTFTQTDDWTAASFLGMFWAAYAERVKAITGNLRGIVPASVGSPAAFGDGSGEDPSPMHASPKAVGAGDLASKVYASLPSLAYEGSSPVQYRFTISAMQRLGIYPIPYQLAGDPHRTWQWAVDADDTAWPVPWTWSTLAAAAGVPARGFTRKFPKEFSSAGQTTYDMGVDVLGSAVAATAIADGDKARCLFNATGYRSGEVYKRV